MHNSEVIYVFVIIFIPLLSGIIGWLTNILAIRMTFFPINYFGIRPIGWQGIVPSKAHKIAEKSVDLLTLKLLNMNEAFQEISPERLVQIFSPQVTTLAYQLTDEVMDAQYSFYWNNISDELKQAWFEQFDKKLKPMVTQLLFRIKDEVEELLDLKVLSIRALTSNKPLLNEVFWTCGAKEFRFIERSGLLFGIPLGIIQAGLLLYFPVWWMLPLCGLLIGYLTNWLAIHLIFRPLYPISFFGGLIIFQGFFHKRQQKISADYAHMISHKILTTEKIFEFIIRGPREKYLEQILEQQIMDLLKDIQSQDQGFLIANRKVHFMKNILLYRIKQELPLLIREAHDYLDEILDLENSLRNKMSSLPPQEFERFLRPAFQEDEWILVGVGSILGCLAGCLQYLLFFY